MGFHWGVCHITVEEFRLHNSFREFPALGKIALAFDYPSFGSRLQQMLKNILVVNFHLIKSVFGFHFYYCLICLIPVFMKHSNEIAIPCDRDAIQFFCHRQIDCRQFGPVGRGMQYPGI